MSLADHTKENFLSSEASIFPSRTFIGAPEGTERPFLIPHSTKVRASISPSTMTMGRLVSMESIPKKSCAPPASCIKSFDSRLRYLAEISLPFLKYGKATASVTFSNLLNHFSAEKTPIESAVSCDIPRVFRKS